MARAFSARLPAGWPRNQRRPSTASTFFPPSSTIDQLPTTARNFDDSRPTPSRERSTCTVDDFGEELCLFRWPKEKGLSKDNRITVVRILILLPLISGSPSV